MTLVMHNAARLNRVVTVWYKEMGSRGRLGP